MNRGGCLQLAGRLCRSSANTGQSCLFSQGISLCLPTLRLAVIRLLVCVGAASPLPPPSSASSGFSDDDSLHCDGGQGLSVEQLVASVQTKGRSGLIAEYGEIKARPPDGSFNHARSALKFLFPNPFRRKLKVCKILTLLRRTQSPRNHVK